MASQLHAMTVADPVRRVSIAYQDPCNGGQQVVVTETPITPPLSPKSFHLEHQEFMAVDGSLSSKASDCSPTPTVNEDAMAVEPVPVDVAGRHSGANVEMEADVAPHSKPPTRLLEDEQVRLQPVGLRLRDFEVRGTLGEHARLRMNNRGLSH